MALTVAQAKEKRKAGMAAMTDAEKIHRELTGGRPPAPGFRTASEAVTAARVLLRELQERARGRGLRVAVSIAHVSADLSMPSTQPLVTGKEAELLRSLTEQPLIMLGLIFVIEDDANKRDSVGVKSFLGPIAEGWMADLKNLEECRATWRREEANGGLPAAVLERI